jgi:(+)-trans-carveol dehydrogenase
MLINDINFRLFRPDLENPQLEDVVPVYRTLNVLPVPWVEAEDIANAVIFLASDEGRYITGVALPVDAGYTLK